MPESNLPPSLGNQPTLGREAGAVSVGDLPTIKPGRSRRFKTGEIILNRYRVLGELGQGGMGVVYRCLDEVGGIEVALKALPPELSHNSVEMEEVRENFQLVSRLVHQHIAAVKTLERDSDTGDYYLILELAEGMDLRRWRRQQEGKTTPEKVLPILRQVADALDFAHSRKIIHRDIKPSNVMVSGDGAVKVLDFGLAAQIRSSMSRVSRVQYETSGTGPYMAPEQWRGQYQDASTDQYALAVMAYELLSGRLPFETQDQVALRESVIREAPEKPEGMTDNTWAVLSRGLSKQREDRYASCAELLAALEGKKIPPPLRSGKARQPLPGRRKSRKGLVLAIAAGIVLLLFAGWYLGIERPRQRSAAEARRVATEAARVAEQERQAKIKAETDDYAALPGNRTEADLKAFLDKHPDGSHVPEAKAQFDKLVSDRIAQERAEQDSFQAASVAGTEFAFKAFLDKYPGGAYASAAKVQYDKLLASRQQTEAQEAKRKAEEAEKERQRQAKIKEEYDAYVLLQANKTESGLKAFLELFPDGSHAKEVQAELEKLRQDQQAKAAAQARQKADEEALRKRHLASVGGKWKIESELAHLGATSYYIIPNGSVLDIKQEGSKVQFRSEPGQNQARANPYVADFAGTFSNKALTATAQFTVAGCKNVFGLNGTLSDDGETVTGKLTHANSFLFVKLNAESPFKMTRLE
jgi:hypothetical protein